MRRIAIITCSFMLVGCEALDCIIDNHPEFSKTNVRQATLNQVYEDTIKVSITNSYMDNEYSHTFNLVGDLPPGISYNESRGDINIFGTPTELGDFPFQLSVTASDTAIYPDDSPEELCSDTESQSMVFTVVQGF